MFYAPIGRFIPNNFSSTTSTAYGTPHQLSFHFLKKDSTTGETREVGINDDLKMIRLLENGKDWTYANLKDVLFFMNVGGGNDSTRTVFSRDKNKFYAYFTDNSTSYSNYGAINYIPNFIHISHDGKDYIVDAKRLNTKNLTLDPIWAPEAYRTQLITKINELMTKYDIRDNGTSSKPLQQYTALYYKQIDENSWLICPDYRFTLNCILVDGKTPFPDCVLPTAFDYSENGYYTLVNTYGSSGYITANALSIPIAHKDYFPYDETKKVGSELTGKFDLYPTSYIKELPQQATILEPMHNLGLIVSTWITDGDFLIFSNVLETQSPQQFDGFREFDLTFYCGERSVKRRYSKRIRWGRTAGDSSVGITQEYTPSTMIVECTADNLMNVYGYTIDSYATYPLILIKDADIYKTPKNQDYDYYGSINEVPVDLYKDTTISTNSSNYPWTNAPKQIAVLQKGFTGKTTLSNPDDYKTSSVVAYGASSPFTESDDMTSRDFRDWEMQFALRQTYIVANGDPTKTRAPYKLSDWTTAGYTEAEGLAAAADNILVDAQFDYFNDVFRDAPLYIVDTKILKTLGLSAPRYHRFMPNRCIWFEVDDLYTYDDTGKITGYNSLYATTDGTFNYSLASFNFFKVKLYENVSFVTYDTQKNVMEDFTYSTNAETGAILDPILQVCDDISEFHIVMWVPLQKAILRIGNIKLNTEVA